MQPEALHLMQAIQIHQPTIIIQGVMKDLTTVTGVAIVEITDMQIITHHV
jgi:hypothetical protein